MMWSKWTVWTVWTLFLAPASVWGQEWVTKPFDPKRDYTITGTWVFEGGVTFSAEVVGEKLTLAADGDSVIIDPGTALKWLRAEFNNTEVFSADSAGDVDIRSTRSSAPKTAPVLDIQGNFGSSTDAFFLRLLNTATTGDNYVRMIFGAQEFPQFWFTDENSNVIAAQATDNELGEWIVFTPSVEALRLTDQQNVIMGTRTAVVDPSNTTKAFIIHNGTGGSDAPDNTVLLKAADVNGVSRFFVVDENARSINLNPGVGTITLGAAVTTFAVPTTGLNTSLVVTGDAGGNTIATITGAVANQILTLLFVDANVTITDNDTHAADSVDLSAAFTSADDTVLILWLDGTSWYEVSRSAN